MASTTNSVTSTTPSPGSGPDETVGPAGGAADGRSTRWEEHRRQRRRELVEATLRAIRAHGPRVGMDEIAAAAGTSKTVFYRHFTDRAGLYRAVAERVDRIILRDLARALGVTGTDLADLEGHPRDLIAAAVGAYLGLVEKDPQVYRFVVAAPLLDRGDLVETGDPAGVVSGHVAEQIAGLVRGALVAGGLDPAPARAWGHGVVGLVRAAADAWLVDGLADGLVDGSEGASVRLPREELTAHLTTLAWSGLSTAWPGEPGEEGR